MDARKPDPLGVSLRLEDGDLVLEGGDFALVSGQENLLQGLKTTIETPLASDVFNVTYGFDVVGTLVEPRGGGLLDRLVPAGLGEAERRLLVESLRPNFKELVRLNLVRALSGDDRIHEVREVTLRTENKAERRWRADVVLNTVAEGDVALQLEGLGA